MRPDLTVEDWLARAEQAQDPAEVRRCLDAAASAASGAWELRRILRVEREQGVRERMAAMALRTLEAAEQEEHEIHAFTDAVELWLELGDRPGAAEALRRAERWLERLAAVSWRKKPIWDWCHLAQTWLVQMGEREDALRCLAIAESLCEDPDDLCTLATSRHEILGDLESARALLERADARETGSDAWTVANAWRALGDPERAERLLERSLEGAPDTAQALTLARAWQSHEQPERAVQAVERAAALARTAGEWFEVARLRAELGHEPPLVRQALDAATALTTEEQLDLRTQLSGAYHRWLGEPWSAQGPLGQRPAALRPVVQQLPGFAPDPHGLFDHLRQQISPASLQRIASSDWGMGGGEHLAVLTDLCETGLLPVVHGSLPWHPHEVLALTRWGRGERVDHLARALSTTILSCLPHEELDNTVPYLVESALVLGEPVPALTEGLLAWLCSTEEPPDLAALLGLALLRLAQEPEDARIVALVVLAEERFSERFLQDCTGAEQWASLARNVAGPLAQAHPETAGRLLAWLGEKA
jgi:tetratricopeptide (TPR) repeat protein